MRVFILPRALLWTIVFMTLSRCLSASEPLRFDKKGEFKILQLTDIHWVESPSYKEGNDSTTALIDFLIVEEKPDLIVITGDIVVSNNALEGWNNFLKPIHKHKTPFVVTFGNHDIETDLPPKDVLEYLSKIPYSLTFNDDTAIDGVGNCYMPIYDKEGKEKKWMLYFFDSHAYPENKDFGTYDWIKTSQIEWYRNNREKTIAELGYVPPSLAFFHIPTPEYVSAKLAVGINGEPVCSPGVNSGLIASFLERNDVLATFVGHDHNNDYVANYLGKINLIYGRKTGYNAAYKETLERGARVIVVYENNDKFDTYIKTLKVEEDHFYFDKKNGATTNNLLNHKLKHDQLIPSTTQQTSALSLIILFTLTIGRLAFRNIPGLNCMNKVSRLFNREKSSRADLRITNVFAIVLLFIISSIKPSYGQQYVTGLLRDSVTNEVLQGVTARDVNSTFKAVSDNQGRVQLTNSSTSVFEFTLIGYKTVTKKLNANQTTVEILMQKQAQQIDEIVAIGYGSVKKKDLTGAVSSIRAEELMKTNPASINQALQGKVSGVVVNQADGAPGAGISIQIRGANSFSTSTEPLYVIDGVPFNGGEAPNTDYATKQTNNPLSMINPRDVVSIDVLKDASATAIYGSRAANGVVLITTKSGSSGKTKVEFSSNISFANAVKKMKVLDAATYAEYRNEQARFGYMYDGKEFVSEENLPYPIPGKYSYLTEIDPVSGLPINIDSTYYPSPDDFRNGYLGGGTNWQDQIFQTAISQDNNLTISGGDNKGQYLFSLGHLNQEGIILNSYYKRYNIRSNINRRVNDWFEFGNNLTASKSLNRLARTNSETYGVIPSALGFNPTRPVFDPDEPSGVTEDSSTGLSNPYLYVRTAKNILESLNIYNSTFAQLNIGSAFKLRQNLGYGYSQNKRNVYYNRHISGGTSPINGYGSQSDNYYESLTSESLLMFNKDFASLHHIDGVLGWSLENVRWGGKGMSGSGFPNDISEENDMGAAIIQNPNTSSKGKSSLMSYFGRVNYTFNEKYLFTSTFRRDGSSRLSPQGRWSNFSSVALAWRISDEEFIKNLDVFDLLKLRLSYGQTGNQGISAYATRSRMTSQQYPMNGALMPGFAEDRWGGPAAPNLKWETTNQYNIGLDVSFLNNRINLVSDIYYKKTKDLLQYAFIPLSTGFSSIATNYGNVENKGVEVSGNFLLIDKSRFKWTMDANISFNTNKISGLDADQFSDVAWGIESMFLRRNEHAIGTLYGYQEDGYFKNEAEVRAYPLYKNESDSKIKSMIGQVKYKDTNGDQVIDDRDKIIIGNTNPNFVYGVTHSFSYDKFSFSFFLQGVQGADILNVNLKSYDMAGSENMPQFVWDNRWTPENRENAQFPRADNTFTRSLKASDRLVEDGSYLRLKNVSLGYQFAQPFKYLEAINLNFSVNNLFTITKYRWFDPDVNAFGNDPSRRGVDMASYPTARTFMLGAQIVF